jgi:hypothetical protein
VCFNAILLDDIAVEVIEMKSTAEQIEAEAEVAQTGSFLCLVYSVPSLDWCIGFGSWANILRHFDSSSYNYSALINLQPKERACTTISRGIEDLVKS